MDKIFFFLLYNNLLKINSVFEPYALRLVKFKNQTVHYTTDHHFISQFNVFKSKFLLSTK